RRPDPGNGMDQATECVRFTSGSSILLRLSGCRLFGRGDFVDLFFHGAFIEYLGSISHLCLWCCPDAGFCRASVADVASRKLDIVGTHPTGDGVVWRTSRSLCDPAIYGI